MDQSDLWMFTENWPERPDVFFSPSRSSHQTKKKEEYSWLVRLIPFAYQQKGEVDTVYVAAAGHVVAAGLSCKAALGGPILTLVA